MTTPAWLLGAVLALPIFKGDREAPNKPQQLDTVAHAIAVAAREETRWPGTTEELKALMLAVAWHESNLSLQLHAGKCPPDKCDRGRARGLWQMHACAASSVAAWALIGGVDLESTLHAAREAAHALTRSRRFCAAHERRGAPWLEMTLSAYGTGKGCFADYPGRADRAAMVRRLLERTEQ